ncbi:MAG: FtsX-like permease family protein [Acidobacteria bacterium]|nr:FtsX-like permease family protein [Acidobacteriota bacterium]
MIRTAIKGLAANRVRMILTGLSIVLGVAFVAGSFVFTDTINARFESLFTDVYAGVDATVRPDGVSTSPGEAYLEADLVNEVRQVDAVEVAVGSVSGFAQMIDSTGTPIGGQGPPTFGFSWVDEPALNSLTISENNGRPPTSAGEVVIDMATAESQGLTVGDEVDIQTIGGVDTFTIVGLASFGSEDNLAGATLSAFELEQAQVLFDLEGRLSAIDVLAVDGVDSDALVAEISVVLPGTAEVVTGEQQTQEQLDQVTEGLSFLSTALLAFAGIAVFVGAFVIQNTFRITVAQRVRELALLRAIGATGTQVTVLVLIEAAILAVVASAVGVLAGIGVAELIKMAMNAAGVGIPDGPLTIQPRTIIVSMAVGISVTMFAALLPARRASSIPPVAAMSETGARTTPKSLRNRTIVGSALTALGALAMTIGLLIENGGSLLLVAAGAVGLFMGMSTLAPLAAGPIARLLSAPMRGITGKLARENTIRQPRRTASTASALMIGVALVAFTSIFAASIKASVTDTLEGSFPADLAFASTNFSVGVSPVAVDEIAAREEFSVVSAVNYGYFEIEGDELVVIGVDPSTISRVYDMEPSIELSELGDDLLVQEDVLVSNGWSIGDVIAVDYPGSASDTVEIVGTFTDATFANYVIAEEVFLENIGDDQIFMVFARLGSGVSLEEGQAAADAALSEFPNVDVNTQSDQIAEAEAQVDQLLALFTGLLGLALVIALLGIANTLALSIVERTREIGLLRAVGMTRHQVRQMVRWEALIIAVFGALLGILIGSAIGFGVVTSLADDGLGSFALPAGQLVIWLVVAAVAGLIASVGPARKAARLDVLKAISYE